LAYILQTPFIGDPKILHYSHSITIQITPMFYIIMFIITCQTSQSMDIVRVTCGLKFSNLAFQFEQMMVKNMRGNNPHGIGKPEKIFVIPTTWSDRTTDLVGNVSQRGRTSKERI